MKRLNRRILFSGILLLAVMAVGVMLMHRYQTGRQADVYLTLANKAFQAGSPTEAVKHLTQAARAQPKRTDVLERLSATLESLGLYEDAYTNAQRIERINKQNLNNQIRLARLALAIGRDQDAVNRTAKLVASSEGRAAEVFEIRGDALRRVRDEDAAIESYRRSIADPRASVSVYAKLARVLSTESAQVDQAFNLLDGMVQRFPDDPAALMTRGAFHLEQALRNDGGRSGQQSNALERSVRDADAALVASDRSGETLRFAAVVANTAGNASRAVELAKEGITRFPDVADFYRIASAATDLTARRQPDDATRTELLDEADQYLALGIERNPNVSDLLWHRLMRKLDRGDVSGVESLQLGLRKLEFSPVLIRYSEALRLAIEGPSQQAIPALEASRIELIDQTEFVTAIDFRLADLHRAEKDFGALADTLKRITSTLYEPTGTTQFAYDRPAISMPDRLSVVRELIQLLVQQKRYAEANDLIASLQRNRTRLDPRMTRMASEVSYKMADFSQAVDLAAQAAEASGTASDHLWHARVCELAGKRQDAESSYRKAIQADPDDLESVLAEIRFLNRVGKVAEAREQMATFANQLQQPDLSTLIAVAETQDQLGDTAKANQLIAKIDEANFDTIEQHERFESLLYRCRSMDAVIDFLESTVTLASKADQIDLACWARRRLAIGLTKTNDPDAFTRGERLLNANLELDPRSIEDRHTLASVNAIYLLDSQPDVPLRQFDQLQQDGWSPTQHDQFIIGRLLWSKGQFAKGKALMLSLLTDIQARRREHVRTFAKLLLTQQDFHEAELWINRLIEEGDDDVATAQMLLRVRYGRQQFEDVIKLLTFDTNTSGNLAIPEVTWFAKTTTADQRQRMIRDTEARLARDSRMEWVNELRDATSAAEPRAEPGAAYANQSSAMRRAGELVKQGQIEAAITELEAGVDSASDEDKADFADLVLASPDVDTKHVTRIKAAFASLVDSSVTTRVIVARCSERLGEYQHAAKIYRLLHQQNPNDVVAANNLATLLALSKQNAALGETLCNKMISVYGPQMFLLDTRGVCRLQQGNLDGADSDLRGAFDRQANPITLFHLAWLAETAEEFAAAKETFDAARSAGLLRSQLHPLEHEIYDRLAVL